MPRPACWPGLVLMAALACSACGSNSNDSAPTEKRGEDPSSASLPAGIFLLDDFEKPVAALPGFVGVGSWYGFDDQLGKGMAPERQLLEVAAVDPHQTFSMKPPSAHALHDRGGPYKA